MNDLDLITGLIPDSALPGPEDLAPARDRLTAVIRTTISAERTAGAPVPLSPAMNPRRTAAYGRRRTPQLWLRWPGRRLALTTCAALAAVTAIATAAVIVPGHGRTAAIRPAPAATSARPASAPPGTPRQLPATVNLAAATFLDHAAAALQQQPARPPGPDQYVYTENLEGGARVERSWLSANGNRPGLDEIWNGSRLLRDTPEPPCTLAQALQSEQTQSEQGCVIGEGGGVGPGYFAGMPTSPHGLSAYLINLGIYDPPSAADGMGPGWLANDVGKMIEEVLPYVYLLPAQQAALFQLMAQTPGFTIVHGVRDGAGRAGVGIMWDYMGGPAQVLVFNSTTFTYMGMAESGPGSADGTALVNMAFVSKAGQLP